MLGDLSLVYFIETTESYKTDTWTCYESWGPEQIQKKFRSSMPPVLPGTDSPDETSAEKVPMEAPLNPPDIPKDPPPPLQMWHQMHTTS